MGNHLLCCLQAENLIKDGYDLTVWNRNKDKCKALQEKGAKVNNASIPNLASSRGLRLCTLQLYVGQNARDHRMFIVYFVVMCMPVSCNMNHVAVQVAESAKAVAEQCDITVAMLADPQAAEAVATGPNGIAAGMKAGQPALLPTLALQSRVCFGHASLLKISYHTCLTILMQARGTLMCPPLMLEQLRKYQRCRHSLSLQPAQCGLLSNLRCGLDPSTT
jgi:hypothetical protein